MTIICVDNTPIMLQALKESANKAYPYANVQTFLSEEPALDCAKKFGCDVLLCEINPPGLEGLFLADKVKKSILRSILFLLPYVRKTNTQNL